MDSKISNTGSEKPMRMTRLVSVILNGVVLSKLAAHHANDVYGMADTLMVLTSDTVKRNIQSTEVPHVAHSLRKEIRRRINIPQTI
jgi:hypothetical protein